jgi:hypothetical protein
MRVASLALTRRLNAPHARKEATLKIQNACSAQRDVNRVRMGNHA